MGAPLGHRREGWLALSGLVSAGLALPLAQSAWHGPEVAAIVAVASVSLLAGQRWPVAVIVLGQVFLLPTVVQRAVLGPGGVPRLVAIATILVIVPALLALPRALAALTSITGRTGTERMYRHAQLGLLAIVVVAVVTPLL